MNSTDLGLFGVLGQTIFRVRALRKIWFRAIGPRTVKICPKASTQGISTGRVHSS